MAGRGKPNLSDRHKLAAPTKKHARATMAGAQKKAYGMSFQDYMVDVNRDRDQGVELLYDGAYSNRPSLRPSVSHRRSSSKQDTKFWNWGQGGFYDTRQSYDQTMSSRRMLRLRDVTPYGYAQRSWMN